jgi:type II restriction enzyme
MSKRITASNIISAIEKLPRNRSYDYVNARTKTKVEIVRVEKPEGPVFIKRYDPSKGQGAKDAN